MADTTTSKPVARPVGDPIEALTYFFKLATTQDHSAARVAACLLLGLYNGGRFKFDLTDLRLLDGENLKRALVLIAFDARPSMEVHQWLNRVYDRTDFGARFEHMAHRWAIKGKCRKAWLNPVQPISLGGCDQ